MKKPELLIPASSLEVLKTAVAFGADAVYIGGEAFGLRAKAKNFSPEDMQMCIRDRYKGIYPGCGPLRAGFDQQNHSDPHRGYDWGKAVPGRAAVGQLFVLAGILACIFRNFRVQ